MCAIATSRRFFSDQETTMSDQTSTSDSNSSPDANAKRGGRRKFFGGLALGGLLGTLAGSSFSLWANEGGHGHHGGGWCRGHFTGGPSTPEQRAARADAMTDRMLSKLDATPEQRTRVEAIVQDAIQDLAHVRHDHLKNRQALVEALKQPSVDREALQQIRQAELKLADSASDRLLNAIADAADVLTPEQRGKLAEMAGRFGR
jgi:Spy/CpxP family protein refolding chaperone